MNEEMSSQPIQISDVLTFNRDSQSIFDFAIDSPQIKTTLQQKKLPISGWILGTSCSVRTVEILNRNNQILKSVPVDQSRPDVARFHPTHPKAGTSGFKDAIEITSTGQSLEYHLRAVLEDGNYILIGSIHLDQLDQPRQSLALDELDADDLNFGQEKNLSFHQVLNQELKSNDDWLLMRWAIAGRYIRGDGIEIGALHSPLTVPKSAKVKYVDRMSLDDLRKHYPELQHRSLVEVDIIDNGEWLNSIQNSTQDFVIANHFLEHCQNPICAVENMLRVLKLNGILYLAIPDKRFTFDIERPITTLEHVVKDYQEGPVWSKKQHFEEWGKLVDRVSDKTELEKRVEQLIAEDYSIHFHVWDSTALLEFLISLQSILTVSFDTKLFIQNGMEIIAILQKL